MSCHHTQVSHVSPDTLWLSASLGPPCQTWVRPRLSRHSPTRYQARVENKHHLSSAYRGGGAGAVQAAMEHPGVVWGQELGGGELLGHLAPAAALLLEHGGHPVTL